MSSYVTYYTIRYICFLILKIFFKFRVEGKDNIPKEGSFIAASNHVSFLDPIALGSSIPQVVHFMARDDLYDNVFFGALLRRIATFPVKRGYQDFGAMKEALKLLDRGEVIGIFPEGTRGESPELREPKLGIGMLAAHSGVPVLPVFIEGSHKVLPKHAKFIKLNPVKAYVGKPLKWEGSGEGPDRKQAYRDFSNEVMESIALLKVSHETKS